MLETRIVKGLWAGSSGPSGHKWPLGLGFPPAPEKRLLADLQPKLAESIGADVGGESNARAAAQRRIYAARGPACQRLIVTRMMDGVYSPVMERHPPA